MGLIDGSHAHTIQYAQGKAALSGIFSLVVITMIFAIVRTALVGSSNTTQRQFLVVHVERNRGFYRSVTP